MYHGKVIYNPSGKAGEYGQWAANFYNGCSAKCEYCYNRHGITANVLGGDFPVLKKSLVNFSIAQRIFQNELIRNSYEIRKHGLFFNFVSDPCLKETFELNKCAWFYCNQIDIPVKILTKQSWWIDSFLWEAFSKNLFSIGFTLTGHDELEPGAATNMERIEAMKCLHDAGFKTWASIEPIIDFESSWECIIQTAHICDLYKIGLQSGKKYDILKLVQFVQNVKKITKNEFREIPVYFKDSLLKHAGITRADLASNCVTRDFNI
jgi:DNA repair photolyase